MADLPGTSSESIIVTELEQIEAAAISASAPLGAEIKSDVNTALPVIEADIVSKSYPAAEQAIGALAQKIATDSINDFTATCFASGTLIRTMQSDIAVEALRVGEMVVTASGMRRPVRWIGHRFLDGHGCVLPHDQQPIRIRAEAFGAGLPQRDLLLSPGHPVLVGADADGEGGHLVPIMCLINGTTIERVAAESVTYWHVELDSHDILLAEGLPAESYIDLGSRSWFAGAEGALFDPDLALPDMPGRCRLVAVAGPVVEAERRRLDAVFASALAAQCAWNGTDELTSAMG